MMSMIDLEAIRERRLTLSFESLSANRSAALTIDKAGTDIDALITEVERLRGLLMRALPFIGTDDIVRVFLGSLNLDVM